jgi:hypothetical protein
MQNKSEVKHLNEMDASDKYLQMQSLMEAVP